MKANEWGPVRDEHWEALQELSSRYRSDGAFRARVDSGAAAAALEESGFPVPVQSGTEVKLVPDTALKRHFVLPTDPNAVLQDEALSGVSGGSTAGTAGTIGSASTASSVTSCLWCAATVGSAGTAGSS